MLIGFLAAAALLHGIDWTIVALILLSAWQPWLVPVALIAYAVWRTGKERRRAVTPGDEATFFGAVAAELRAGAALRGALVDGAARVPNLDLSDVTRRCLAGQPVRTVAGAVAMALPNTGRIAAAAVRLAAGTGGRSAAVFERLADRAAATAELQRERASLSAQARLSALVVAGAPVLLGLALLATGRAGVLLDHGSVGIAIAAVGLGLELSGAAVVLIMLRRSS